MKNYLLENVLQWRSSQTFVFDNLSMIACYKLVPFYQFLKLSISVKTSREIQFYTEAATRGVL